MSVRRIGYVGLISSLHMFHSRRFHDDHTWACDQINHSELVFSVGFLHPISSTHIAHKDAPHARSAACKLMSFLHARQSGMCVCVWGRRHHDDGDDDEGVSSSVH